jgi:hypothetical protein
MTTTKAKQLPVCSACDSSDVRADAYAEWDADAQDWSLVCTFDNTDCEHCGGECSVQWVNVDSPQARRAEAMADADADESDFNQIA